MTIIEFFDKSAIENILSALLCAPDRVVFIGDSTKRMKRSLEAYREVLKGRALNVELLCHGVRKNDLGAIVEVLTQIVEREADCVFNLDGGEDLYLVAVGMVAQKFPDRVRLHRFNVRNNTIIDIGPDGSDQLSSPIEISIAENIRIYGGRVVGWDSHPDGTVDWQFDDEFRRDLEAMWQICRHDPKDWNNMINTLDCVSARMAQADGDSFRADAKSARAALKRSGDRYVVEPEILRALEQAGVIRNLDIWDDSMEFDFKNRQVRKCLTKAGQVLELVVHAAALDARDGDGNPMYNDVSSGVYIDWDAHLEPEGRADVSNEIDVLLMKGAVPVFISCKNGFVDVDELYKLSHVAHRFGGRYARKVLVATRLDDQSSGKYIRARAEDMGIRVIEDLGELDPAGRSRLMAKLWNS